MSKYSLKFNKSQMQVFKGILYYVTENAPLEDLELESVVVAEMYQRYISKFTFIKESTTISLQMSEAISINRVLQNINFADPYAATIARTVIGQLDPKLALQ
jgi:uncharacterized protein YbbC (DUF1343 family)